MVATVSVLALLLAACGSSGGEGDQLNFYIFDEPSGSFEAAAEACSGDDYTINVETLPSDADQQREQLVRRLAAGDTSIDLIGMDVIWTAEFAGAEWILPFEGEAAETATEGRLEAPVQTATYEDQIWGAPFTSNTQLLWYRSDLVDEAPETWDEMLDEAERLAEEGEPHLIQAQGQRYEGLTVFANTMIQSAGTEVLGEDGEEVVLEEEPTRAALDTMARFANSVAAADTLSTSLEDTGRLEFEAGESAFMLNYPFVYPSAEENAPDIFEDMEYAVFPSVVEGEPAQVTIGGINVGVGAQTADPERAFEAANCIASEENQKVANLEGGLPPTSEALYEDEEIQEAYPFIGTVLETLQNAAVRPKSPRYNDVSLAISGSLHPMAQIDDDTYDQLVQAVERALQGEGLL
ncbi:ABC transporter substrate-binding protein [Euzebya sp.]|uniref:ABC transporter substrate-binding protein n=1 Tax=Euzebya sp. TaxID=1971409 RepID=UPI00355AC966